MQLTDAQVKALREIDAGNVRIDTRHWSFGAKQGGLDVEGVFLARLADIGEQIQGHRYLLTLTDAGRSVLEEADTK